MVQASLRSTSSKTGHFVQIMVNDHLIIGKKLIPNTGQRINYGVGSNTYEVDSNGGYFLSSVVSVIPITRVAIVYLRPGVYTFNVGTRTLHNKGEFLNGAVIFELTQFENGYLTSVGGYDVTDIPK